ncbi:MAG: patatin-like phospholipase family protein [Phycisphaeraceae bacterium]|nr:patatin-like phospholipase family protein [Phycisphaeraceae bacterium]
MNASRSRVNHQRSRILHAILAACLLAPAACSSPQRLPAVPDDRADRAIVLNTPALRTWDDTLSPAFLEELFRIGKVEFTNLAAEGRAHDIPPAHYLAISGGGAEGAYGAGILCGWTDAGTRPEFKIVTGISTGALTAPFAFLGPAYDDRLRQVYTSVTTEEIARKRGILAAIYNDALMDTVPLRKLLAQTVDEPMMRDIATEYAKGRILLVATTNLDANRGVIWNIGAIAATARPEALDLIHNILIASAAIPAAFPPVMFDVEVDGTKYQEMHVDGGAKAQVFLYPPTLHLDEAVAAEGFQRERVAYIIRNARLDPKWVDVRRKTLPIAGRAIDSLIQTQGVGDLYRIYITSQRDGVDFNLAFIPATFNEQAKEAFDPVYMTKLFDVGYAQAIAAGGYPWHKSPPGLDQRHSINTTPPETK